MACVEPVVGEAAAVAAVAGERVLLVADVHAGIETGLRYERGVELDSRAAERRDRVRSLLRRTDADRLVVLGDLAHRIAAPTGDERAELSAFVDTVTERVPLTLVEGNHDGGVAETFTDGVREIDDIDDINDIDVIGPTGGMLGEDTDGSQIGVVHGHTWPAPELLTADVVCMGHEHPQVRLADAVGGARTERAWLRGEIDPVRFLEESDDEASDGADDPPELVVFPAFNERSGGTWINVDGQSFLAPFLPEALPTGEAYLLDGTRLGEYRQV
ncbi:metallophosphoesterase [Halorubrum luteum]